ARAVFALVALSFALTHFLGHAHAQSSLGIGSSEALLPSTGPFAGILNWINLQQKGFYRSLTGAMRTMRDGGGGAWVLVGVSIALRVSHAVLTCYGKAVISSYMLANELTLRRGVMLSFVTSTLQAATAIAVITAVCLMLRGSSISMSVAS